MFPQKCIQNNTSKHRVQYELLTSQTYYTHICTYAPHRNYIMLSRQSGEKNKNKGKQDSLTRSYCCNATQENQADIVDQSAGHAAGRQAGKKASRQTKNNPKQNKSNKKKQFPLLRSLSVDIGRQAADYFVGTIHGTCSRQAGRQRRGASKNKNQRPCFCLDFFSSEATTSHECRIFFSHAHFDQQVHRCLEKLLVS